MESKISVIPPHEALQNGSLVEPPLRVKGDRGCSEKQEIPIARWGCPSVRAGYFTVQHHLLAIYIFAIYIFNLS
ncbi:hypothetical protein [Sulfuracidifex tepidarius]|uniref:hypothetical protein n=1 Tax=Sulfuracidifex tepidarius TaxID=1294262 RepID=UPI00138F891A|nr:hypothetical protein [Sulfuracidifex tepidarius]